MTETPTAIELATLTAVGTTVRWATSSETDILGFNLLGAADEPINAAPILAGTGSYEVDTGVRAGGYKLQTLNADLSLTIEASLDVVDASPVAGPASKPPSPVRSKASPAPTSSSPVPPKPVRAAWSSTAKSWSPTRAPPSTSMLPSTALSPLGKPDTKRSSPAEASLGSSGPVFRVIDDTFEVGV